MALLHTRRRRPEVMDDPSLDPRRHADALVALARINRLSRTEATYFPHLRDLQARHRLPRLRVLDVASGGGDVSRRLLRLARRAGLDWHVAGCDLSPVAVGHARAAAEREDTPAEHFVHDVHGGPPPGEWDAVVCSLFLHHLDEAPAVAFLRAVARPQDAGGPKLVLVNDLSRGVVGWLAAHVVGRLLTRCDVVHTDGPRSVEGAFTPAEAVALARAAGLTGATARRVWPWRWLLRWHRPAP